MEISVYTQPSRHIRAVYLGVELTTIHGRARDPMATPLREGEEHGGECVRLSTIERCDGEVGSVRSTFYFLLFML